MYGKKIRMSKIIKPNCGKGVILPYAHGVLAGPIPGIENIQEFKRNMRLFKESGVTGIIISPSYIEHCYDVFMGEGAPSPIFVIDWCNLIYDKGGSYSSHKIVSRIFVSIEKAIRYGAVGVIMYLLMGHEDPERDAEEIRKCGLIIEECEKYGLPVIIEPCMGSLKSKDTFYNPKYLKINARIASELGADIIKSHYTGNKELFKDLVNSCPTPVMVAGGEKSVNIEETIKFTKDAMEAGAAGIVAGRKIFQSDDPRKTLQLICDIVYRS